MSENYSGGSVFYRGGPGSVSTIVSGTGATVTDDTGRDFIDAMGGVAVQIVGHGNESVARAIIEATEGYAYTYTQKHTTKHQIDLVERLTARLGLPAGTQYYFGSGGSDANEMAIKFARQYHLARGHAQKYKVVRREHAYHGNTLGTLAVSDRPSWRRAYDPYLFNSPTVPGWLTKRSLQKFNGDEMALTQSALDAFERVIWSEDAQTISALIMEPMSGSSIAGAALPAGYLEGVRDLCDRHDILLISDEVFVGYGRIGLQLAMEGQGVVPDIITLGKGLGSGYAPLSAAVLSPKVHSGLGGADAQHNQGYTFSGIPLSCAVGVAVSDFIEEHQLFSEAARLGTRLHRQIGERLESSQIVGEVRGRGMLVGIELVQDRNALTAFDEDLRVADRVARACLERGVLLSPGSPQTDDFSGGDQIHIAPPYVITEAQIDDVVAAVGEAIDEVTGEL